METITTQGGHDVDFDRIVFEELKTLGHEVTFYVPEEFRLQIDYGAKIRKLKGKGVTYASVTGIKKIFTAVRREISRQKWYHQIYQKAIKGEFDAVIVPTATYIYLRALNLNICRKIPVPIIFIIHAVNPGESVKLLNAMEKFEKNKNIKAAVLSFGNSSL